MEEMKDVMKVLDEMKGRKSRKSSAQDAVDAEDINEGRKRSSEDRDALLQAERTVNMQIGDDSSDESDSEVHDKR